MYDGKSWFHLVAQEGISFLQPNPIFAYNIVPNEFDFVICHWTWLKKMGVTKYFATKHI